jgi:glutamyl-tRNA synthetase
MSQVRVRFAPSPTGFFHIGSARTALFNWLYACHTGGTFILRIEDTDNQRNTDEALRVLLEGMRWLGLNWDEGPEVGGEYGPYFQSQRTAIYQRYLQRLLDIDRAYEKDGAIWFRLLGERYTVYDDFKKQEVEKVRNRAIVIDDAVRGRVERVEDQDFVIFRQNGEPVFHFVNVVDDIEMRITHVIRGEDHLSNTSKHAELFEAFGAPLPVFAHIPLILKESGPGKMSKRDKGALIEEYEQRHFLPEAVRNYLCLLGWNPKDDQEKMPIDSIIEAFDFTGINKGNARFDERKLSSMNTAYLRELPIESFCWLARPILNQAGIITEEADEDYLQKVLALCQPKARSLETLAEFVAYFFIDQYPIDAKAEKKIQRDPDWQLQRDKVLKILSSVESFDATTINQTLEKAAADAGIEPFAWFPLIRFAVSGQSGGPDLMPMLETLGKECVIKRLQG